MKALDRFLQQWRIKQAAKFILPQSRVLDVGCHQGELFHHLSKTGITGVGVDPLLKENRSLPNAQLLSGTFPGAMPALNEETGFNSITLLAVLEHFPESSTRDLARECVQRLLPKGRIIITVPSPAVDSILSILKSLRLIDGMSLEEHHGFKPADTLRIFAYPELKLIHQSTFQLGLNHLFVFEKIRS